MQSALTGTPQLPQIAHPRNPGMALDLDWVASVQANTSAIERRCATLGGRAAEELVFGEVSSGALDDLADGTIYIAGSAEGSVLALKGE